ncbi:hypothetical protein F2Q69_00030798 [Brassica cretica]|uniref:ABC transporter domain-containing protein n=1 Tax=Brassica cretica TaxID=69181 RepID=A0A8S9S782_BRACR|nr:hypothetical protein F2Q69_00030798 [Brassica cretica]
MNHQRWFDLSGFNDVTNLLNSLNSRQARHPHSMTRIHVRVGVSPLINSWPLFFHPRSEATDFLGSYKRRTWWGVDMLLLDAKISISINSASMVCSSVKLREHKEELQRRHYAQVRYVGSEKRRESREEFMGDFKQEMEITKKLEKIHKVIEGSVYGKLIPGLGFVPEDADRLVASFSGGWQMRMSLRNIQLQDPELLLLDEPTNHLDLDTIEWLEGYFQKKEMHMVIISHDRAFLISCVPKLWKTRWLLEEHSRVTTVNI